MDFIKSVLNKIWSARYSLSKIEVWLTCAWLVLSIVIFYFYYSHPSSKDDHISIGEIGSFLVGVFAPVAWYWFYLSYKIQTEELRLQRQELADSVIAQQGSEEALKQQYETMKEQSEALKEQLAITTKQWNVFLAEKEKSKPSFIIRTSSLRYCFIDTDTLNTKLPPSLYDIMNSDFKLTEPKESDLKTNEPIFGITLYLNILNTAGDCKVKFASLYDDFDCLKGYIPSYNMNPDEFQFNIDYISPNKEVVDKGKFKGSKEDNIFDGLVIKIYYSISNTSNIDSYRLDYHPVDNYYTIEKISA